MDQTHLEKPEGSVYVLHGLYGLFIDPPPPAHTPRDMLALCWFWHTGIRGTLTPLLCAWRHHDILPDRAVQSQRQ